MHKGVNMSHNFCSLTLKSKRKTVLPPRVLWVPFKPWETGAGCGAVQATQSERKSAARFPCPFECLLLPFIETTASTPVPCTLPPTQVLEL